MAISFMGDFMLRLFYKSVYYSASNSYYELLYSFDESENDDGFHILSLKEKREINKVGNLEFSFSSVHPKAEMLSVYNTYVVLADDDTCLFYGRISELTKDFNNLVSVTCEGILGVLYDRLSNFWISSTDGHDPYLYSYTKEEWIELRLLDFRRSTPTDLPDEALLYDGIFYDNDTHEYIFEGDFGSNYGSILFENFINRFGGVFIENLSDDRNYYIPSSKEYRLIRSQLDYYGSIRGFIYYNDSGLEPDYSETISDNPEHAEELEEKSFKFGLNMLDVSKEYPITEIATGIQTSYTSNRGDDFLEGVNLSSPIFDSSARSRFGTIVQYVDTSEKCDDSNEAESMAQKICNFVCALYDDKLTIKGIDPHYIDSSFDRIRIGDAVNCYSAPHSINTVLQCLSYDIDYFNHKNDSYVIGPYVPNGSIDGRLTESIKKQIGLI